MHFALKFSSLSTVSASMYSSWWYWNASCMVAYLIRSAYTMGKRPILSPIEYNLPCCQYYSSTFIASNLIQKCINGVAFLQIIFQLSSFINKCQQKRNNIELCVPNLPRKENGWIIVSQGFIVKYSVAKLVWVFNKIIEMVMKKHFKSCVLGGIADQPQPPHDVSPFIWPGPKVAIMNPIILQYSFHSCCHSFLRIIDYIN